MPHLLSIPLAKVILKATRADEATAITTAERQNGGGEISRRIRDAEHECLRERNWLSEEMASGVMFASVKTFRAVKFGGCLPHLIDTCALRRRI